MNSFFSAQETMHGKRFTLWKIKRGKLFFRDALLNGLQVRLKAFLSGALVCRKNEIRAALEHKNPLKSSKPFLET